MKTIEAQGMTFEECISKEEIAAAVQRVADQINHDYEGREPLFICTLNGAFIFAADLFRKIKLHSQITFIRLKSYDGTATSGQINEIVPLYDDVYGRDVIILEDIIDSGYTMQYYKEKLQTLGVKSIAVASLLFKPEALLCPYSRPEYVGLEIPKEFIIGCGFDLDEYERNHEEIYRLRN